MSNLKKIEDQLIKAPNIKAMMQLDVVQERFIANYQGTTQKKDGKARFQLTVFEYLEIINEKPELQQAERFSHFAAIVKIGRMGLPLSKLYVIPGKNKTVKVQSTPAGKREMLENMDTIRQVPEPQLVLKGDFFVFDKLTGVILKHETTEKSVVMKTLDDIVASYQRVIWKDGTINDVVLFHNDLLKAKSKSPAQSEASFWSQWPGEAAKKVATNRAHRLYHKYPDGEVEFGDTQKDDDEDDDTQDVGHQEVALSPTESVNTETGEIKQASEVLAKPEPKVQEAKVLSSADQQAMDFLK